MNKLLNKVACWFGKHDHYPAEIVMRKTDFVVDMYCLHCGDKAHCTEIPFRVWNKIDHLTDIGE